MEKIFFYENTPVGKLCIGERNGAITRVTWQQLPKEWVLEETELIRKCKQELDEFFEGKRKTFDLPLAPEGTAFQKRVWDALREIPYGETRTYKDIAIAVDSPKGFRAVGMANNKNPIAIMVPCHRVIGTNGKLVGYAAGMEIKTWLLALEQRESP
ncbi:MAG: methylated-DNA--[protein]-cysteine S-methyltransferase [Bacteroidales bacterium]|nr:methylated-DNA--[protein]-cysteine S-methyltransferase [Anaerotignum sp.]MCI5679605.1 methylated-DNA--[protein]-cysteine S-methyltransferase [Bacteroidales bacterium]MDY3925779.1 methylated-DNA--[protein]-cysteine S-methyltransferase [Anaerotignum sp.]